MIARTHLITIVAILMESSDHYRRLWREQRKNQDRTLARVFAKMHWRARTAEAEVQAELSAMDAGCRVPPRGAPQTATPPPSGDGPPPLDSGEESGKGVSGDGGLPSIEPEADWEEPEEEDWREHDFGPDEPIPFVVTEQGLDYVRGMRSAQADLAAAAEDVPPPYIPGYGVAGKVEGGAR